MSAGRHAAVNKALGHELRVLLLERFAEVAEGAAGAVGLEPAGLSPKELSGELGEKLARTSYHVVVLLEAGAIELVDTVPRRGAVEHYYRSTGAIVTAGCMDDALARIAAVLRKGKLGKKAAEEIAAILADVGHDSED